MLLVQVSSLVKGTRTGILDTAVLGLGLTCDDWDTRALASQGPVRQADGVVLVSDKGKTAYKAR
jgi:hypothetical protein